LLPGELSDLKNDLNGDTKEQRKNAIKKVIASMTVGKDVGALFPDVLKNMQAEDIETKKLVYLYLMNYAKSHPEIAILAVNTFVKVRRPALTLTLAATSFSYLSRVTANAIARSSVGRRGPEPTAACTGHSDDGLHPRRQNPGLPVPAARQGPEGTADCEWFDVSKRNT